MAALAEGPAPQGFQAALRGEERLGPGPRVRTAPQEDSGLYFLPEGWPGPEESELVEPHD
eukprot:13222156-Alexandrium_andersonii.AAC.1